MRVRAPIAMGQFWIVWITFETVSSRPCTHAAPVALIAIDYLSSTVSSMIDRHQCRFRRIADSDHESIESGIGLVEWWWSTPCIANVCLALINKTHSLSSFQPRSTMDVCNRRRAQLLSGWTVACWRATSISHNKNHASHFSDQRCWCCHRLPIDRSLMPMGAAFHFISSIRPFVKCTIAACARANGTARTLLRTAICCVQLQCRANAQLESLSFYGLCWCDFFSWRMLVVDAVFARLSFGSSFVSSS